VSAASVEPGARSSARVPSAVESTAALSTLLLVGNPNVGKTSLFTRAA
jgi:GTP1/Obg family GTP-binding protein